jgi:hypothetical protein
MFCAGVRDHGVYRRGIILEQLAIEVGKESRQG